MPPNGRPARVRQIALAAHGGWCGRYRYVVLLWAREAGRAERAGRAREGGEERARTVVGAVAVRDDGYLIGVLLIHTYTSTNVCMCV